MAIASVGVIRVEVGASLHHNFGEPLKLPNNEVTHVSFLQVVVTCYQDHA